MVTALGKIHQMIVSSVSLPVGVPWETQRRLDDVASTSLAVQWCYSAVVAKCRQHLRTKSDHHYMQ